MGSEALCHQEDGQPGTIGMPVETEAVALGRAHPFSKECRLSVSLPRSRAAGMINGGAVYKKTLYSKLTYLPVKLKYKLGEEVFTSGLSGWTPSSLYVGRLITTPSPLDKGRNCLYCEGIVGPALDFESLRFIMVVQREASSSDAE